MQLGAVALLYLKSLQFACLSLSFHFFMLFNNLHAASWYMKKSDILRRWSMCPSNFLPLSSYKLWSYGYTLPIGTIKHFSVIVLIFDILYIFFRNIKFYSLWYFEVFTRCGSFVQNMQNIFRRYLYI
jgi:hypothetical protein